MSRRALVALAFAVLVSGCTRIENSLSRVPFFAYLRDAPSFDPYEAPRPAPRGSVAFLSPAGEAPPPITPSEAGLNEFSNGPDANNPFPVDSAFQALGVAMYDRHCAVCHGPEGLGLQTGLITTTDPNVPKYPPIAPNLTMPPVTDRTDGYLYGMIAVARSGLCAGHDGDRSDWQYRLRRDCGARHFCPYRFRRRLGDFGRL